MKLVTNYEVKRQIQIKLKRLFFFVIMNSRKKTLKNFFNLEKE